jgi:alpha-glucosidase (family GH31 glycosyl hydrolase)
LTISSSLLPEVRFGKFRIQILSDALIRCEIADISGFEEQSTFHIEKRFFSMPFFNFEFRKSNVRIFTRFVRIEAPVYCQNIQDLKFKTDHKEFLIKETSNSPSDLPEPGQLPDYWVLSDYPRIIPPEMGATAPSKEFAGDFLSGWQISDNCADFYVFFPKIAGYNRFRQELLNLVGNIPLIPKFLLGFIYSRYHPFKDSEIFELVRQYKLRKLPIDMFVVDTDWREGASTGYQVNQEYFPDIETFFNIMHEKNVRVMFNDHPEPFDQFALSPVELQKREEGLASLLEKGLDCWWYDRNWKVSLDEPVPGLGKDVWGMRLYYDISQKIKPLQRVAIMANVPGIRNGIKEGPSNIATHRYPVWWTGDTQSDWKALERAIENAVNCGIHSLLPFVSEDLGGHLGDPSAQLYSRFIQFGCFSPIFRLHCTANKVRDPWKFGDETERIFANYLGLRLKLLPMLYSAAMKATEYGEPLLRRCDLEWPEFSRARCPDQYMFADDLLVAPVFKPVNQKNGTLIREVWIPPGFWHNIWNGKIFQGPATRFVKCHEWVTPVFARDGAIIVSQPEIVNSSDQVWKKLIVDIFVPEQKTSIKRQIYEDDGISNTWLEGNNAITNLSIKRDSGNFLFRIQPAGGSYNRGFSTRTWLLRFHCSAFTRIGNISLNKNLLLSESYKFIKKFERPTSLPFLSREGYTGMDSNGTVEITIKDYAIDQKMLLELKLVSV